MTTKAGKDATKKRPKRAPIGERRRTFTFRLDDQTRQAVEAAADAAGRSVSEELEWRVKNSFENEDRWLTAFGSYDTMNVLLTVASTWQTIERFSNKKWATDQKTWEVCKESTNNILSWVKRRDDALEGERPAAKNALAALGEPVPGLAESRFAWEAARRSVKIAKGRDLDEALISELVEAGMGCFGVTEPPPIRNDK